MATNARLSAQKRTDSGKGVARKARAAGRIPAVVYGHGEETRSITVDAHELEVLFGRVHYENTIIELAIEGEKAPVKVLVREVQSHAFKKDVLHVDFYQVHAGEKLTVEVPIRVVGSSPGVKAGGILNTVITDLEIRCLPDQIPDHIDLDVSALNVGDVIHVGELALPAGAEPQIDADRVVLSITAPTVSAAAEAGEGVVAPEPVAATGEPEVIKRGKEADED